MYEREEDMGGGGRVENGERRTSPKERGNQLHTNKERGKNNKELT